MWLLPRRVTASLGRLEFLARSPMRGTVSGKHTSPHKGASVEFEEHRAYVPGDDPRDLDGLPPVTAHATHGVRSAANIFRIPLRPRPLAVRGLQHAEQGVVVQPVTVPVLKLFVFGHQSIDGP